MKNLFLENSGIEKLDTIEMSGVSGGWGKMKHAKYTYINTDNELLYTAEAAANGIKFVYNRAASAWNWGYDRYTTRR